MSETGVAQAERDDFSEGRAHCTTSGSIPRLQRFCTMERMLAPEGPDEVDASVEL